MSTENVKTPATGPPAEETMESANTETIETPTEVSEVKGSSMGGHSPKGDTKPESQLVRSFGKWAKGKQSTCVRVLTTHHPELCASRPGGCNGLCAWLKDQFRHSTKWRTGNKKNLVKKAVEGYIELGDGDEFIIPKDMMIDFMAAEADIVDGKRPETIERPDWFTSELEDQLIEIMDNDNTGESTEADLSYTDLQSKLGDLIRNQVRKANNDSSRWPYVKDVYPGYVIYSVDYTSDDGVRECDLYKQQYSVASENVTLVGDPSKVVKAYVAAESDVDEPVSNPLSEEAASLNQRIQMVDKAIRERYSKKSSSTTEGASDLSYVYVRETYDNHVIFSDDYGDEQLWKQNYKFVTEGMDESVELVGDRIKVALKYVEESDSTNEESAMAEDEVTTEYVTVEGANGSYPVQMDRGTGEILRGPDFLVGKYLPIDELPEYANESLVNESGIIDGEGAVEMVMYEHDATDSQIVEAAADGKKLKTPKGSEVDGIMRIIVPGPGNARDKFYYTAEAIKGTLGLFDGKKMYKDHTTPKQDAERNGAPRYFDDWVAVIQDVWTDESGVGYGGVKFVDDTFAAKAKKGMNHLGVSVRGRVKARPSTINGTQYNVVEGFTYGGSVDFVTEAGAGGGFVSIAESDIMEGLMDPKDMTLAQLKEANPEAFVKFAEELKAESKEGSTDDGDKVTESGVTLEQVKTLLEGFKQEVITEVKESLTTRDVQDNRMVLENTLKASGLPKATQARLRREFHDATFDGAEATESEAAKTPLEVFTEKLSAAIEEAETELKEATESITTVDDGGTGELAVTEAGRVYKPVNRGEVTKRIEQGLGIKLVETPATEAATDATTATA